MTRQTKAPDILRIPIDRSWSLTTQVHLRFSAIFALYGISEAHPHRFKYLAVAMARERFPKAFRHKPVQSRDPRSKVGNLKLLRKFVEAIQRQEPSGLPPNLEPLGKKVIARLKYQGKRVNQRTICGAISALPGSEWHKIPAATLRDNIQRAPGSRSSQRANRILTRALVAGLQKSIDEIDALPDEDED